MNSAQKTIRTIAIGFAWFLSITIIVAIVSTVLALTNVFDNGKNRVSKMVNLEEYTNTVEKIEIESSIYNIELIEGDIFSVDLQNVSDKYDVEVKGKTLKIGGKEYKRFGLFNFLGNSSIQKKGIIIVSIPSDMNLKKFEMDGGVGNISIDSIYAEEIEIDGGVGDISGNTIAANKIKVNCGAGNVKLFGMDCKDVKIDGGVGNIELGGQFTGDLDIDAGLGNIDLSIQGNEDDYKMKVEQGLGSVKVDGKKISGEYQSGNYASQVIDIDGGVGNVTITFNN